MFFCAAKPGLSRVIMDVLDFQSASIRCRPAVTLRAGPNFEVGWCVGKTIREVLLSNCWDNAIALGCDDDVLNVFDGVHDTDGTYNTKHAAGIMGDPNRVVKDSDTIIFLSKTSTPQVDFFNQPDFKQQAEANKLEMTQVKPHKNATKDVLICGWRNAWDDEPDRIKLLISDVYSDLGPGSTVTFATRKPRIAFNKLFMTSNLGFKIKGDNWAIEGKEFEGLEIRHYGCDPVKVSQMEKLFSVRSFDCAIVLGTVAGIEMPDSARDSRVLSILLILRRVSKMHHKTLHVVAENQQVKV